MMMSSVVKLVVFVLLVFLSGGEGLWINALIDQKHEAPNDEDPPRPPSSSGLVLAPPRRQRWAPEAVAPPRPRRSAPPPCGLRSVLLQVRHLGLGYDSDEAVLFKYCGGSCPPVPSNHQLTLTNLLQSGLLPPPPPGEAWPNAPCCRPTHHEDMAFLDNAHRWHRVEKLSAAGCSCEG